MLAKNDQTPRANRKPALSLTTIASVLAPTGENGRHKKAARKRLFSEKTQAYFRPDIFWIAPLSSASEQSAQVPLGGIELIPVMALARMPSRPPW